MPLSLLFSVSVSRKELASPSVTMRLHHRLSFGCLYSISFLVLFSFADTLLPMPYFIGKLAPLIFLTTHGFEVYTVRLRPSSLPNPPGVGPIFFSPFSIFFLWQCCPQLRVLVFSGGFAASQESGLDILPDSIWILALLFLLFSI